jgi:hypothetical protein
VNSQNPVEHLAYNDSEYDWVIRRNGTIPKKIANICFISVLTIFFLLAIATKNDVRNLFAGLFVWIACYFADATSSIHILYSMNSKGIYVQPVGFIAWDKL